MSRYRPNRHVRRAAELATPNGARAEGKYPSRQALLASMGIERIARFAPLGYQSKSVNSDAVVGELGTSTKDRAGQTFYGTGVLRFAATGFSQRSVPRRRIDYRPCYV